jgi:Zn-dependent protease
LEGKMFGRAFKIGTVLGFRLEISFTFLIILALFMITSGVVGGLVLATLVFSSVVVHELGHAVVARRLGVPITGIELHILGGAAKMARMPRTAAHEIWIAIAGPAVSLVLGAVGVALWFVTGLKFVGTLGAINLMLGGFNMLPALPMDGGRVLRAALSRRLGRYKATHIAATVAQVMAGLFVVVAIAFSMWMLIALAVLLWFMAAQERAMAGMWRYEDEEPTAQVVDQYGRVINGPWAGTQAGPQTDHSGYQAGHVGPVYSIPTQPTPGASAANGPTRRVIRLPNGMVMVVEEHIRW